MALQFIEFGDDVVFLGIGEVTHCAFGAHSDISDRRATRLVFVVGVVVAVDVEAGARDLAGYGVQVAFWHVEDDFDAALGWVESGRPHVCSIRGRTERGDGR